MSSVLCMARPASGKMGRTKCPVWKKLALITTHSWVIEGVVSLCSCILIFAINCCPIWKLWRGLGSTLTSQPIFFDNLCRLPVLLEAGGIPERHQVAYILPGLFDLQFYDVSYPRLAPAISHSVRSIFGSCKSMTLHLTTTLSACSGTPV